MNDMIIGPPPESRRDRLMGVLSNIHPTVWAAIAAGIFGLLGLWLGSCLQSGRLQSQVDALSVQLSQRDQSIQEKTAEIQRLETILTPFRTIALERFTGPESEALRKLADQLLAIEKELNDKTSEIDQLRYDLSRSDPNKQPIRTAIAKVEFHIESQGKPGGIMDMKLNAVAGFGSGRRPLLILRNKDLRYQKRVVRDGILSFTFSVEKDLTEDFGVQTMETLASADNLVLVFSALSGAQKIVGGTITCTFNGTIQRSIPIPEQTFDTSIIIPIQKSMLMK